MFNIDKIKEYENKILNMDCIYFLKQCPDKIFDLVLTDPPYGIDISKTGKVGGNNLAEVKDYGKKRLG